MRLIALPSVGLGKDWFALTQEIDLKLEDLGMDLAEEAVYLVYSAGPEKVLEGEGKCLVARSVTGPKRSSPSPFVLQDWTAAPVYREKLEGVSLEELLEKASQSGKKARNDQPFFLRLERQLKGELKVSVEAIFHE